MSRRKGNAGAELLHAVADATPPDATIGDNATAEADDKLYAFVRQIFDIEADIKELNGDKTKVFATAKSEGYDVDALRGVIRDLRSDQAAVVEKRTITTTYHEAIARARLRAGDDPGTPIATRASARARGDA